MQGYSLKQSNNEYRLIYSVGIDTAATGLTKRSQCTDIQVYTISIKISAKLIFIVSERSQKFAFETT